MMTLGERILQLRTAAGISQKELGHQLNITRQTVSRWELDQALPTIDRIVRLSRLFGVTTDSLLVDGISTFAGSAEEPFCCGVYRGKSCEAVETERFAYLVSLRDDGAWRHGSIPAPRGKSTSSPIACAHRAARSMPSAAAPTGWSATIPSWRTAWISRWTGGC